MGSLSGQVRDMESAIASETWWVYALGTSSEEKWAVGSVEKRVRATVVSQVAPSASDRGIFYCKLHSRCIQRKRERC